MLQKEKILLIAFVFGLLVVSTLQSEIEYEYHVKNSYIESNNENLIEALLRDDRTANHERLIKREQDYINERLNSLVNKHGHVRSLSFEPSYKLRDKRSNPTTLNISISYQIKVKNGSLTAAQLLAILQALQLALNSNYGNYIPPTSVVQLTTITTCGSKTMNINCGINSVIAISSADYGRTTNTTCGVTDCVNATGLSNSTCKTITSSNLNCSFSATSIINSNCNGQSQCNINVDSVFASNDPCPGIYKYLTVTYSCKTNTIGNIATGCSGSTLNINCGVNNNVVINSVTYGRKVDSICGVNECSNFTGLSTAVCQNVVSNNLKCGYDGLNIVKPLCNGLSQCYLNVDSTFSGIDPCSGTYKYVAVDYNCTTAYTVVGTQISSCPGNKLNINCGVNGTIKINNGFYGRRVTSVCGVSDCVAYGIDANACQTVTSNNLNCSLSNAQNIIQSQCEGQNQCIFSDSVFSDPCLGTFKYALVDYTCNAVPITGTFVSACSGKTINIDCGVHATIKINNAFYGRKTTSVCGVNDCVNYGLDVTACQTVTSSNLNCSLANATTIVKSQCEGQNQCIFSDSVFSDPCLGTFKYTTVDYTCVAIPVNGTFMSACPGGSGFNIDCGLNGTIRINNAFYGRKTTSVCGVNDCITYGLSNSTCQTVVSSNLKCSLGNATGIIQSLCEGQNQCIVNIDTAFSDPCSGVFKYATVDYTCIPIAIVGTLVAGCGSKTIDLDCGTDKLININTGYYGRKTASVCGVNDCMTATGADTTTCKSLITNNLNCSNNETYPFHKICQGSFKCSINIDTAFASDPCLGTYKYAALDYSCSIVGTLLVTCSGSTVQLDCGTKTIQVNNGFYGRRSTNVCGLSDCIAAGYSNADCQTMLSNVNCADPAGADTLIAVINDPQSPSSQFSFTEIDYGFDPCPGTFKYFAIDYSCV